MARFEGESEAKSNFTYQAQAKKPTVVKSANDVYYDPNHPDADWAGLVKKENVGRKKVDGFELNRSGLQFAEGGIMSAEHAGEFDPIGLTNKRQVVARKSHGEGIVIAGPEPIEETQKYWNTAYQAMAKQEPTNAEFYTETHQGSLKGGKKIIVPQYEQIVNQPRRNTPPSARSSFGSARSACGQGGRSLLAGIGEQLASSGSIRALPSDVKNMASANINRKELIKDNFRDLPPGYTGAKRPGIL